MILNSYALLLGSAPEDYRQKKIEEMFDFLDSKKNAGDSIVTFANGISELMLEAVLGNSLRQNPSSILLYICTLRPIGDGEKSIWLGGEEIRCDVVSHYQKAAEDCGIDMQVVFDFDVEVVAEEEIGWEDVSESVGITKKNGGAR